MRLARSASVICVFLDGIAFALRPLLGWIVEFFPVLEQVLKIAVQRVCHFSNHYVLDGQYGILKQFLDCLCLFGRNDRWYSLTRRPLFQRRGCATNCHSHVQHTIRAIPRLSVKLKYFDTTVAVYVPVHLTNKERFA